MWSRQAHALSCTALCRPMRWLVLLSKLSTVQLRPHPYWEIMGIDTVFVSLSWAETTLEKKLAKKNAWPKTAFTPHYNNINKNTLIQQKQKDKNWILEPQGIPCNGFFYSHSVTESKLIFLIQGGQKTQFHTIRLSVFYVLKIWEKFFLQHLNGIAEYKLIISKYHRLIFNPSAPTTILHLQCPAQDNNLVWCFYASCRTYK